MVQTFDISNLAFLSLSINSLKYLRSTTLGYKDIEIRKSEFVAKTQLLYTHTLEQQRLVESDLLRELVV